MHFSSHGQTHPGKVRHANEDAFFINEKRRVYAVADGLGGLPGGADASRRIVELLDSRIAGLDDRPGPIDLGELTIDIHRIVAGEGFEAHPFTGAGSTLTLGHIHEDQLYLAHVGDSAAYLLRHGKMEKLTIDHTMEEEFIRRIGESARIHMPPEYPHTLTRCVGQEEELRVDQTRLPIQPGDRLVFCTDGLNKVLSAEELRQLFRDAPGPEALCQQAIDAANDREGPDNITVVAVFSRTD